MKVFRIVRTKYANDFTGEGARLYGGRWNNKLIPCIYCSESRALAVLEYTVNCNVDDIPRALSIATYDIGELETVEFKIPVLPGNWQSFPAPSSTKNFGSDKLKAATHPVIKIPSVVIPDEWNYLINTLHPQAKKIKILSIKDFVYDIRIKNV